MHIAFISYEYPPDTATGGIATYVYQAARALERRGHDVELFVGSPQRDETAREEGVTVHRVRSGTRADFTSLAALRFAQRHRQARFHVLEGPDFRAEAHEAVRFVPDISLVVRLHTPQFLVHRVRDDYMSAQERARMRRHAARRHVAPRWNPFCPDHDAERRHLLEADEIVGISRSITEIMIRLWRLPQERVCRIANPYTPSRALLDIPLDSSTRTVTYLGRLERRKGALEMAGAIPAILHRCPDARFRFVGRSAVSPRPDMDMRAYLEAKLYPWRHAVEFTGPISPERVPEALACTDLCVFPSLWENFPYVCMEAMAAGRSVIGSRAGGMEEMLDEGRAGLTVPPASGRAIAGAVTRLLRDPALRMRFGLAARERILTEYDATRIAVKMEQSYERAIARRHALGPRRAEETS